VVGWPRTAFRWVARSTRYRPARRQARRSRGRRPPSAWPVRSPPSARRTTLPRRGHPPGRLSTPRRPTRRVVRAAISSSWYRRCAVARSVEGDRGESQRCGAAQQREVAVAGTVEVRRGRTTAVDRNDDGTWIGHLGHQPGHRTAPTITDPGARGSAHDPLRSALPRSASIWHAAKSAPWFR